MKADEGVRTVCGDGEMVEVAEEEDDKEGKV